ncbi:hypothetical protein F2Q70_00019882 [Brassica cretica]|uniref:Uncharacterized protein n=1 Tax=Brassica cretica TaxID=69181 RepID=A0A8S9GXY1_BRACR|nr:hypothetical protein F2Q70_00019882 [Brassica cretica]KAF3608353.1 hypothetical protein DY000_02045233 [Brassica cretica]
MSKTPVKCVATPLSAEGFALREAVRTCANLGLKAVIFKSYSVQTDQGKIPREKNVLADCLAKDASTASGTLVVGDAFITSN